MPPKMSPNKLLCWTITDDFPGMKSQVVGLSEAVGISTLHKTCTRKWPIYLPLISPLKQLTSDSDSLAPPWPDLIITCGRRSAPLSLAIKKLNRGKTFSVHIQDPLTHRDQFDLIISPEHDQLEGSNVIRTKGALHKITESKLKGGIKEFGHLFADLPRPYSSVLIGGSTNRYKMSREAVENLIQKIADIQRTTKGSVLVTPSFRTPYRELLKEILSTMPNVFLADIERLNPYFAMLGIADYIFVTDDSVSMVSEACFTGVPVYILPLLHHGPTKPKRFIQQLVHDGTVRIYEGEITKWAYGIFNDSIQIAKKVREMLDIQKG